MDFDKNGLVYLARNLRGNKLKDYKKVLEPFNQKQRDIIVGTLLGDCTIRNSKNKGLLTYRLKWHQKLESYIYVNSIYEDFSSYVGTPPKISRNFNKKTKKTYYSIYLETYIHEFISLYATIFYFTDETNENKWTKKVPFNIEVLLTPRALAYWFMDDGSRQGYSSYILCTDNFTKKDIEFLIETLRKRYGLVCKVFFHNGYPRIRIQSQSVIAFNKVVQPYIHSIFQYKIIPREELKGYYAMKVPELRALCKSRKIVRCSGLRKQSIIGLLKEYDLKQILLSLNYKALSC